jgi:hypothetical protein
VLLQCLFEVCCVEHQHAIFKHPANASELIHRFLVQMKTNAMWTYGSSEQCPNESPATNSSNILDIPVVGIFSIFLSPRLERFFFDIKHLQIPGLVSLPNCDMSGKEYRLRVTLKVKQLLDCPLESKSICVRLLWGRCSFWGGKTDQTQSQPCKNRKVLWDEDKNCFEYECKVYMENSIPTDNQSRLFKRQPSSAHLSISVKLLFPVELLPTF